MNLNYHINEIIFIYIFTILIHTYCKPAQYTQAFIGSYRKLARAYFLVDMIYKTYLALMAISSCVPVCNIVGCI